MPQATEIHQIRFNTFLAENVRYQVDIAVALLWLHDHFDPGYQASAADLAIEMSSLRLAGTINRSRLKSDLQKHVATIEGTHKEAFRIRLSSKSALDSKFLHLIDVSQTAGIEQSVSAVGNINEAPSRIFIGHGRSSVWRDVKDFLQDRLGLNWEEFNRESVAGISTVERIQSMLDRARFAFLVLTAEDANQNGSMHARENVIHEAGLFQGRLGFKRAIVLLEEGCSEFSNIQGLGQIRFPRGGIAAVTEDIRRVLERENIVSVSRDR